MDEAPATIEAPWSYENLLIERDGSLAVVSIHRPKALNALNRAVIRELTEVFQRLGEEPGLRCILLTGSGEKAFVAGADIAEMQGLSDEEALVFAAAGQGLADTMAQCPKIIIAAVNGFALGGGTELAMACDFIYAAESARFGQPEVNLGVIPGLGGTQRLPRRVGSALALELIVTGEIIGAAEAHRIGLVNKVFPAAELMAAARATAKKIAEKGPLAVEIAKRAVHASLETSLADGNQFELQSFSSCFATEDQKEGMAAFLAKRPPAFIGR